MIERFVEFTAPVSAIYKAVQKIERQEMERFGLQGPHVKCLMAVSRHPEGICAARLAEICQKDKASVSRSLAVLEQKGLVCRASGYRGQVHLTKEGTAVTEKIEQTANIIVEAVSLDMSETERAVFYEKLEQIARNLQKLSAKGAEQ